MKTLIILLGTCITFVPVLIFVNFLLKSIHTKPAFSYHLEKVFDKKGKLGVGVAYLYRIILSFSCSSLGVYLSSYFTNTMTLKLFFIGLLLSIILSYFDKKFDSY